MKYSLFSIAFSLFLLMDPLGNIPLFIVILENVEKKRQRQIIFRETLIALGIIITFAFLGNWLMEILQISHETIYLSGGIVLFLLAINMVFPSSKGGLQETLMPEDEEPLVFPLAVPLLAGPSVLAAVMIYSHQEFSIIRLLAAITLAWLASTIILLLAPAIRRLIGRRGIKAMERLMGLILILISLQMFLEGITIYLSN
jgi:multiple antibiotic resistance protein